MFIQIFTSKRNSFFTGCITHYSYDVHGNVDILIQDIPALGSTKRIDYKYDLVSGKVNQVIYQNGQPDQFIHKYEYDADNRLTNVFTSLDNITWDQDAKYYYYLHGLLAREEIGNDKIQGIDYAYTIQGWIKAVNSDALGAANDMGTDGLSTGINKYVSKDASGYSLGYYTGDYKPIGSANFLSNTTNSDLAAMHGNMYNGNITQMVTTITDPSTGNVLPMGTAYHYDQLNRITRMRAYANLNLTNNTWGNGSASIDYNMDLTYDANGNILTLNRNGAAAVHGTTMDNLQYTYYTKSGATYTPPMNSSPTPPDATNKLAFITDAASGSLYTDDIKTQGSGNYAYDKIGNLTQDISEDIASIDWTVYGKVKQITRTTNSTKSNLTFTYDALGNRITKRVAGAGTPTTYYIHDAQGNIMATYKIPSGVQNNPATLIDLQLYGSKRLGTLNVNETMANLQTSFASNTFAHMNGGKQYEFTNHLGNVLATITDRKIAHETTPGSGVIGYYTADISSSQDYYPGGMLQPGRNFNSNSYNHGYQGSLKDREITGTEDIYTTFYRELDTRTLRWWTVDPAKNTPWESPYMSMGGNPILLNDPFGDFKHEYQARWYALWHGGTVHEAQYGDRQGTFYVEKAGKSGGISHRVGNVLGTVQVSTKITWHSEIYRAAQWANSSATLGNSPNDGEGHDDGALSGDHHGRDAKDAAIIVGSTVLGGVPGLIFSLNDADAFKSYGKTPLGRMVESVFNVENGDNYVDAAEIFISAKSIVKNYKTLMKFATKKSVPNSKVIMRELELMYETFKGTYAASKIANEKKK